MNNILILGYYYRYNLGDDLFEETIPDFFKDSKLTFMNVDEIPEDIDFNQYTGIIFGGGDLINDYFFKRTLSVRAKYSGPIYAFSVGIPYFTTIPVGYLQAYDHVFTRNKSFLVPLQHALGSQYAHYLPDSVMSYNKNKIRYNPEKESDKISCFFAGTLNKPQVMFKICISLRKVLEKYPNYKLHLYCFDTKSDSENNDKHINTAIFNSLAEYKDRIINDTTRYNGEEMLHNISSSKLCICSRFHSHILSILTGTPFVSLHYANKVSLLLKEKELEELRCPMITDARCKPVNFDENIFINKFDHVYNNISSIHDKLIYIRNHDQMLLKDNYQVEKLITRGQRRIVKNDPFFMNHVDFISNKYTKEIEKTTGVRIEEAKHHIKDEDCQRIAKMMLYEITGEISSSGIDGTITNLKSKPEKIRDMVDWVWKEKGKKTASQPCYNMRINCNQTFNGIHRSGWKFATDALQSLHSNYGVILDIYCDATFGWCKDYPCKESGMIPYTSPWCGFFHHTPSTYSENNIEASTNTLEFKQSLETCLGFYVLSEWLAVWLREKLRYLGYPDISVCVLYHPTTSFGIYPFDKNILKTQEDPVKIVNIGAWLRNTWSIYEIDVDSKFEKYRLKGRMMNNYFPPENISFKPSDISVVRQNNSFVYCLYEYIRENNYLEETLGVNKESEDYPKLLEEYVNRKIDSVKTLEFLPNEEYDRLLQKYVVFVDFIECSAANTLIECMIRGTPIICNRFPAVVEYLGEEYPLYFDNLREVSKICNVENIEKARIYMDRKEIKEKVCSEKFYEDFYKSEISEKSKLCNHLDR